jgi:thiamine-monophosphate kinase
VNGASSGEKRVSDLGEKAIIETILRPLFNPENEANSVGDDCAALSIPEGCFALISTDRVPADLISFRTGAIGPRGLGRYLAVLNLSDIAACGGRPLGLLFNCGLPGSLPLDDLVEISHGLAEVTAGCGAKVVGGDVTSSIELSLSATVIGYVDPNQMLRRRGARAGDSVFVTRAVGLTPLALDVCLNPGAYEWLPVPDRDRLLDQFRAPSAELDLGRALAASGLCTAAMDNTDGIGQSLIELARESRCGMIIREDWLPTIGVVVEAARRSGKGIGPYAMRAGADFCLVGTLAGRWTTDQARSDFGQGMTVIGEVVEGSGVSLETESGTIAVEPTGWNYLSKDPLAADVRTMD